MEALSRAMRRGVAKPRRLAAPVACLLFFSSLFITCFAVATPQEERQGSRILNELESGTLKCGEATASDFELVGEYAMGRMFDSPARHEAMNRLMTRMMGSRGEEAAHETMGRRISGCGGAYGGRGSMMGGYYGSMMGGYSYRAAAGEGDEGSDGPSAGAMVGMMAVLIAAVALALFLLARWRPGGGPLETLKRRYASGEMSAAEYRERKNLLEGG